MKKTIVIYLLFLLISSLPITTFAQDQELILVAQNIGGDEIKLAISNNSPMEKELIINVGDIFLKEKIYKDVSKIIIPPKSALTKIIDFPKEKLKKGNVELNYNYIFIKNNSEIIKQTKIDFDNGKINFTIPDLIFNNKNKNYFYIANNNEYFSEVTYEIEKELKLKGVKDKGEIKFLGINNSGLVKSNSEGNNLILKTVPKGAKFEVDIFNDRNSVIAYFKIKKIVKNSKGYSEGYIDSPKFIILGDEIKLIDN